MPFLPSTPGKTAPRTAVAVKRTTVAMPRQQPGNTGPLPPGMGSPRGQMSPGMPRGPVGPRNTGPLPPGMGSPRGPMAPRGPMPSMPAQRPFAAMAEGGKAKKPAAKKAAAKKKPGKK